MKLLHDLDRSSSRKSMKLTSGNQDSMVLGFRRFRPLDLDSDVSEVSEAGVCIEGKNDDTVDSGRA